MRKFWIVGILFFAVEVFSEDVLIEKIIYPADVIVFNTKELETIKKETTKYFLAKAFAIAQASKDKETAATILQISKKGTDLLRPFALGEINFSLVPESNSKEVIEGENLVIDAYTYGVAKIKNDDIIRIAKEWNTSSKRIIEGLQEAICYQIRNYRQIFSPLDPIEPFGPNFKVCVFTKENIFFSREKKITEESYPRNTILILKANTQNFKCWKIEKELNIQEISSDILKIKISEPLKITAIF